MFCPGLIFHLKPRRFKVNIRRFTQFAFVLAIVALIAGLSACDQIQQLLLPAPPQMGGLSGEIIIGVSLPLDDENAPLYGLPMQRGFELAREELNQLGGPQITFIIEDDQSTVEGAKAAFNKLIHQDGVSIITGITFSTQLKELIPIVEENGVVCFSSLSSAAGLSALSDFVFRTGLPTNVLNPEGVRVSQEKLSYQRAALIYDEDDVYSTSSNEEVSKALAAGDVDIVITETIQTEATDFRPQLTRIMETDPDAIFISALSAQMTEIMIQGREVGILASVPYIVPDLTGNEVQIAGEAAEGAITFTNWSATADTPGNQAFVQNYLAKYGIEADPWAAQSYATLYILAEAIANAQSTEAAAVRDALAVTMDFPTVMGNFSFDEVGDAVYDPIVLIVENGELKVFE